METFAEIVPQIVLCLFTPLVFLPIRVVQTIASETSPAQTDLPSFDHIRDLNVCSCNSTQAKTHAPSRGENTHKTICRTILGKDSMHHLKNTESEPGTTRTSSDSEEPSSPRPVRRIMFQLRR